MESVEYFFIAITPWSTLTQSSSTCWDPINGFDKFDNNLYSIGLYA